MGYTITNTLADIVFDEKGNETAVIDAQNGSLPATLTVYDDQTRILRVCVEFEKFSFKDKILTAIVKEFLFNERVEKYLFYQSGKYRDNRFTADNNSLVDISQNGKLVEDILADGDTSDPQNQVPEFTALFNSPVGAGVKMAIYKAMGRKIRN